MDRSKMGETNVLDFKQATYQIMDSAWNIMFIYATILMPPANPKADPLPSFPKPWQCDQSQAMFS